MKNNPKRQRNSIVITYKNLMNSGKNAVSCKLNNLASLCDSAAYFGRKLTWPLPALKNI